MRALGYVVAIVESGDTVLTTCSPGATTSGFAKPAAVGPCDDQGATSSSAGSVFPRSSRAPTVSTVGPLPGLFTVPFSGPSLPAAATTTMPRLRSFSTPRMRGSAKGSCVAATPKEMLTTLML